MSRIGRNDPCHCGSGKKYKKCCFEADANQIPWPALPEEQVVNELKNSSAQFKAFYETERPKFPENLVWAHDRSLPEGTDCLLSKLKNNEYVIRLKTDSSFSDIRTQIAHELTHAVLEAEGFRGVYAKDKRAENTCTALNDMVLDLLVNTKLKQYNFDFPDSSDVDTITLLEQSDMLKQIKLNKLSKLEWTFYFASDLIDQNLLEINYDKKAQDLYEEKFPEIANQAKEVFALVKEADYETPEKVKDLFEKIIEKYNLSSSISVDG